MSPTCSHIALPSSRRAARGFTLTELIVAMAIFITLMGGMVVLFSGVVNTVSKGYQFMDAFEVARSTMGVMQRDLEGAFVSLEQGDIFQLYGARGGYLKPNDPVGLGLAPHGFIFIGTLASGQIGRVSYVFTANMTDEPEPFTTNLSLPWWDVYQCACNPLGNAVPPAAFFAFYPPPIDVALLPEIGTPSSQVGNADLVSPYDFRVRITTGSVIRYEEPGIRDLDTFRLPPSLDVNIDIRYPSGTPELKWPDIVPNPDGANPAEWDTYAAGESGALSRRLYTLLLSVINPDAPLFRYDRDLRWLIAELPEMNPLPTLNAISWRTSRDLVAMKRREIWLRILADDPTLALPSFWKVDQTTAVDGIRSIRSDTRPDMKDYRLTSNILYAAALLEYDGANHEPTTDLPVVGNYGDVFIMPGFGLAPLFIYSDYLQGSIEGARQWLDALNLPGYEAYIYKIGRPEVENEDRFNVLLAFDDELYRHQRFTLGSPQELGGAHLPCFVTPEFWVVLERTSIGRGDYRRRFTQAIEIPQRTARASTGI